MPGLDTITRRIHVFKVGPHAAIDPNGSLGSGFHTALDSQAPVGLYAGRNQHQVCAAVSTTSAVNNQAITWSTFDTCDRNTRMDRDAVPVQLLGDDIAQRLIESGQHRIRPNSATRTPG